MFGIAGGHERSGHRRQPAGGVDHRSNRRLGESRSQVAREGCHLLCVEGLGHEHLVGEVLPRVRGATCGVGAADEQHEHRDVVEQRDHAGEQPHGRGVRTIDVVDDEHHRTGERRLADTTGETSHERETSRLGATRVGRLGEPRPDVSGHVAEQTRDRLVHERRLA